MQFADNSKSAATVMLAGYADRFLSIQYYLIKTQTEQVKTGKPVIRVECTGTGSSSFASAKPQAH